MKMDAEQAPHFLIDSAGGVLLSVRADMTAADEALGDVCVEQTRDETTPTGLHPPPAARMFCCCTFRNGGNDGWCFCSSSHSNRSNRFNHTHSTLVFVDDAEHSPNSTDFHV